MAFPIASPARCELRFVIRFLCTTAPPLDIDSHCVKSTKKSVWAYNKWCRNSKTDGRTAFMTNIGFGRNDFEIGRNNAVWSKGDGSGGLRDDPWCQQDLTWQTMPRFAQGGSRECFRKTKNGNVLKRPANFFSPTKPMARNSWTLLSPGSATRHRKRNNVPVGGNTQSRRSCGNSNEHCLPAKGLGACFGTGRVIVVHFHAWWYNNQCGPLLWDVEKPLPRDSKQEERHVHEGSAFPARQHSSFAHRPNNSRVMLLLITLFVLNL